MLIEFMLFLIVVWIVGQTYYDFHSEKRWEAQSKVNHALSDWLDAHEKFEEAKARDTK